MIWLGLFLLTFAARLRLIQENGFAHPYWDQWYSEGQKLLIPYQKHEIAWSDLLSPNSEHRILLTRLVQLGLVWLDGQWDDKTQQVLNAFIYSCASTTFLALLYSIDKSPLRLICTILFAMHLVPPTGWANILWGFQLQFYFLIFGSTIAVILASNAKPFGYGWFLSTILILVSFFGMAGGALTPFVCAFIAIARWWRVDRSSWPFRILPIVWCSIGLCLFAWTPAVPHNTLRAHSIHDFLLALLKNLSYPCSTPLMAIPVLAVFAVSTICIIHPKLKSLWDARSYCIFGILFWSLMQAAALALDRANGGAGPVPRYHDVLGMIWPSTIAMLLILGIFNVPTRWPTKSFKIVAAILGIVFTAVSVHIAYLSLETLLPARRALFISQECNLRRYIESPNDEWFSRLDADQRACFLPPTDQILLLRNPALDALWPSSIRRPIANPIGVHPTYLRKHSMGQVIFTTANSIAFRTMLAAIEHGVLLAPLPSLPKGYRWSLTGEDRSLVEFYKSLAFRSARPEAISLERRIGFVSVLGLLVIQANTLLGALGAALLATPLLGFLTRKRESSS